MHKILLFLSGISYFILKVIAWHALLDAPHTSPISTTPLGDSNFVMYRKRVPWNEALSICESTSGGRLAMLPTINHAVKLVTEIKAISTAFTDEYDHAVQKYEFGMDRRYWIGLSDLSQEGGWLWVDNETKLNYDFWYPNQPDHVGTSNLEHCVVLWNPAYHLGENHSFNDEDCLHKNYFICEKHNFTISPQDRFTEPSSITAYPNETVNKTLPKTVPNIPVSLVSVSSPPTGRAVNNKALQMGKAAAIAMRMIRTSLRNRLQKVINYVEQGG